MSPRLPLTLRFVGVALAWMAAPGVVLGQHPARHVEEQTVYEIGAQLRCVVCQNLSVADSPSEMATQMRGVIKERLAMGERPEQVIRYFVDKYGGDPAALAPGIHALVGSSPWSRSRWHRLMALVLRDERGLGRHRSPRSTAMTERIRGRRRMTPSSSPWPPSHTRTGVHPWRAGPVATAPALRPTSRAPRAERKREQPQRTFEPRIRTLSDDEYEDCATIRARDRHCASERDLGPRPGSAASPARQRGQAWRHDRDRGFAAALGLRVGRRRHVR